MNALTGNLLLFVINERFFAEQQVQTKVAKWLAKLAAHYHFC
jgi:hypothetical protein